MCSVWWNRGPCVVCCGIGDHVPGVCGGIGDHVKCVAEYVQCVVDPAWKRG